ncbi:MAG: hypothetical protein IKN14_07505 [Clostridiales bacterium]|nr:hypothetical protein [Clostridiales bacterium]
MKVRVNYPGDLKNNDGVYVVCSDESLLENMNDMFSKRGVIGITESDGRMRFIVDGRKRGKNDVADNVGRLIRLCSYDFDDEENDDDESYDGDLNTNSLRENMRKVFAYYKFDMSLIGTQALSVMVHYEILNNNVKELGSKGMFSIAGIKLNMNYQRVERNVRYAIGKSRFSGSGMKSVLLVETLARIIKTECIKEDLVKNMNVRTENGAGRG